jgi:hypothetical protein
MICLLELRSFEPIGTHTYAKLYLYDEDGEQHGDSVSVMYKLGHLQARAMNKCNEINEGTRGFRWEADMECNAFFTREQAIEAAKNCWREYFPQATKLVLGTRNLAGYEILKELNNV